MKIIRLPLKIKKAILACGADLKGAFALAKSREAYLFDGFGDLSDLDNYTRYEKAVKGAIKRLKIKPQVIACDMHPSYFSTQFAESLQLKAYSLKLFKIQHHEAHVASIITDNDVKGRVLGVAFDGTGYGTDGNIWGGEFFAGDLRGFRRVAHLKYIPMPGGEQCIREPWRMAVSFLYADCLARHCLPDCTRNNFRQAGEESEGRLLRPSLRGGRRPTKQSHKIIKRLIDKRINSPLTSSAGRLFDAAASLILNRAESKFEAELPIELERIARPGVEAYYKCGDTMDIIKGIARDIKKNVERGIVSAKFHNTMARMILKTVKKFKLKKVVLSGGVFQNKLLSAMSRELLESNGFTVYTHSNVDTNDSGIPIGQIAIANTRNKS